MRIPLTEKLERSVYRMCEMIHKRKQGGVPSSRVVSVFLSAGRWKRKRKAFRQLHLQPLTKLLNTTRLTIFLYNVLFLPKHFNMYYLPRAKMVEQEVFFSYYHQEPEDSQNLSDLPKVTQLARNVVQGRIPFSLTVAVFFF